MCKNIVNVRRGALVLALCSLFLCPSLSRAQMLYHQIGAVAYGGYSSMVSSSEMVLSPGRGYHTTLGFDYELQFGHMIFSTGLAFQWRAAGVAVDSSTVIYPGETGRYLTDDGSVLGGDPRPFKMSIYTAQRTDYDKVGEVQIPLLVGGLYGHCYFLGGLKVNIPLFGITRTNAHFTTRGIYEAYPEPVSSAPYHGFVTDYSTSVKGPRMHMLPLDIMASFEVGYNFSRTEDMVKEGERTVREMRMRLAAYADYSVIPLHQNSSLVPFTVDEQWPYDVDRYSPAHVLATDDAIDTYLANFNVGIKFTVLFGNKQRFRCLNCEAAVESANSRSAGIRRPDNRQTNTTHHTTTPAEER